MENRFLSDDEQEHSDESEKGSKSGKKTSKKPSASKKSQVSPNDTLIDKSLNRLTDRWQNKRLKTVVGGIMVLIAVFTFIACISYFFTWQVDQSRVINKPLFSFLFEKDQVPVVNWLGKFGAWVSHLLMYRWFGISSLGIVFLLFLLGFKWMLNIRLLPITRSASITFLFMVWGSIFFGFFVSHIDFLGGTFGFAVNNWLALALGRVGAFVFIALGFWAITVILFNADIVDFYRKLSGKPAIVRTDNVKSNKSTDEEEVFESNTIQDIHIINTIKDFEIEEEKVSHAVKFEGHEHDEENKGPELEFDNSFDEIEELENSGNTEFEGITSETESQLEQKNIHSITDELDTDFDVSVADPEQIVSDDQFDKMRQEYGDYDPTLDLSGYLLPPIDLLKEYGTGQVSINKQELEENKNRIVETLSHYKIDIEKIKATVGPTVTLYEIVPAKGVRISKIKNLEDDIALSLAALGIRIIAPIPGKGTIGIEVPNSKPDMVSMRSLIASEKFQNSDMELPIVIGKTITNETFCFDLTKAPHLLVAGSTGQGKSVGLNAILVSLLYKKHPAQVKFVLIDPKKVELTLYKRIERHFLAKLPDEEEAIITDTSKVVNTLNSLCIEMDARYELLKEAEVRTIKEYNAKFIARRLNPEKGHRYMPYIVVLIDEFADLIMTAGKEVEHPIARLAQLARAIGIHLIVATQRPSVNVITGMIKANFPARIAFRVQSKIDSRTILDANGADQLIGRGDMLVSLGSETIRVQCGFADTPEVEDICKFIGEQRAYPDALLLPEYTGSEGGDDKDFDLSEIDSMFADAARIVVINNQGSASLLQRKLKLGYNRAGRIVDQLEAYGIIGPFQGSKAREVLFSDIESLNEFLKSKGIDD
jgi:DNA segregation ATPase FtsK/SpoIIIE, S-DNA-T family